MRTLAPVALLALCLAWNSGPPVRAGQSVEAPASDRACAPLGTAFLRTTLYFGLTHRGGDVSEGQWQGFLRNEVTPRFPDGLTVWEASGQWRRSDGRIEKERAKVLLLVHPDSTDVRAALGEVVTTYKKAFQQESVLWETATVCAAF